MIVCQIGGQRYIPRKDTSNPALLVMIPYKTTWGTPCWAQTCNGRLPTESKVCLFHLLR